MPCKRSTNMLPITNPPIRHGQASTEPRPASRPLASSSLKNRSPGNTSRGSLCNSRAEDIVARIQEPQRRAKRLEVECSAGGCEDSSGTPSMPQSLVDPARTVVQQPPFPHIRCGLSTQKCLQLASRSWLQQMAWCCLFPRSEGCGPPQLRYTERSCFFDTTPRLGRIGYREEHGAAARRQRTNDLEHRVALSYALSFEGSWLWWWLWWWWWWWWWWLSLLCCVFLELHCSSDSPVECMQSVYSSCHAEHASKWTHMSAPSPLLLQDFRKCVPRN